MKTNRWIESSQRFYCQLLHLYPQAYRTVYEMEMFRVFTDQCREIYKQRGALGILLLWPRTLIDVGVTAFNEHITDPQAKYGLLEALPNEPLPWKGVLLVLIPGLIFFVSQIMQLTSTKDWFFLVSFRGAYFLILPVLLVWLLTRQFPVWGLIPFGLLYATLWIYGEHVRISKLPLIGGLVNDDTWVILNKNSVRVDGRYLFAALVCAILLFVLIWYNTRRRQISRAAWRWLGLCGLLIVFLIGVQAYTAIYWHSLEWPDTLGYYLYYSLSFLLLIFIGIFFAHKYGGLSFLILLGYLLPTIIFGRYGIWNDAAPFFLVSVAVLVYRFVVALVAPVWLVRAASIPGRQRAAAIPVAIAIISQISLNIIAFLADSGRMGYRPILLDYAMLIWGQLIIAAGLGLAVALYLPRAPGQEPVISPPSTAAD